MEKVAWDGNETGASKFYVGSCSKNVDLFCLLMYMVGTEPHYLITKTLNKLLIAVVV